MPIEADGAAPAYRRQRLRFDYQGLIRATFGLTIFCGAIALVEPSPYDFASFLAITVWCLGGFRVNSTAFLFIALIAIYNFGGFVSLIPHLDEWLPTLFMLQSLYLAITAVFFVLFFSEDTLRRTHVCLVAFTASTILAAICGILGYFNVAHLGAVFSMYGRASGTFKDPNVLGSYLIMGALFLMQRLILSRTRRVALTTLGFLIVVAGIFLSFSRGSWMAFAVASIVTVGLTFVTTPNPQARRRITILVSAAAALGALAIAGLLADSSIRSFFFERAAVTQDYDVGETGPFRQSVALAEHAARSRERLRSASVSADLRPRSPQFLHQFVRVLWMARRLRVSFYLWD